jgi:hypothetical protein
MTEPCLRLAGHWQKLGRQAAAGFISRPNQSDYQDGEILKAKGARNDEGG